MVTPQEWTEVRVVVPGGWQELVADWLCAVTGNGTALGRPNLAVDPPPEGYEVVRSFFPASDDSTDKRDALAASLKSFVESVDDPELAVVIPEFKRLPAEDYANSWRKSWRPFRLGRICIVEPDSKVTPREGELLLRLEPGGAFGTGRHPTTRACLRALQERPVTGARVLDAGSGSGILSVGAALLGAREVVGFDVDEWAANYAEELSAHNATQDRCTFRTGGFECLEDGDRDFDVVLANIYSDVIQEHAGALAERLRPGGWFAFSGCPDRHAEATSSAIRATGLSIEQSLQRGRWCSFIGVRP